MPTFTLFPIQVTDRKAFHHFYIAFIVLIASGKPYRSGGCVTIRIEAQYAVVDYKCNSGRA